MDLLLLHGAIGSSAQFTSLLQALSGKYKLHILDFTGHGTSVLYNGEFSIQLFTNDVAAYMDANNLSKVVIFGYSMGGFVALNFALTYPERVIKIITLATKFRWDEETAAKEVKMLDPEKIILKLPAFAESLRIRHVYNTWQQVLYKTGKMMIELGKNNPLANQYRKMINVPVMLLLGDRDTMVTLDETVEMFTLLPNARLGVLPGTAHPIEKIDLQLLCYLIEIF